MNEGRHEHLDERGPPPQGRHGQREQAMISTGPTTSEREESARPSRSMCCKAVRGTACYSGYACWNAGGALAGKRRDGTQGACAASAAAIGGAAPLARGVAVQQGRALAQLSAASEALQWLIAVHGSVASTCLELAWQMQELVVAGGAWRPAVGHCTWPGGLRAGYGREYQVAVRGSAP